MKHVVFLVGSYYPYYSAVGKCIGNIASEFEKKNKVTIICEKNRINQLDNDVLNTQTIIRITTKMHYNRIKIEDILKKSHGIKKYFWKVKLLLSKIERFLRVVFSKSACDKDVINAYMIGLARIKEPIDVIIPTCNQFESVVAAMQYKAMNNNVQIIPYLFDLFAESKNINRGKLLVKLHWKANIEYERKMFETSTCVFHVSNWTKHIETYFPEYINKSIEVEHPLLISKNNSTSIYNDGKIHIVYTGVVDTAVRNPDKALNVLSNCIGNNIYVDFYSYGSAEYIVEKYASKCKSIKAHGQVDTNQAEEARGSANILVSLGNTNDTKQIPSKIFEYIASGKPIIHFANNLNDPTINVLKLYPLAKIIDLSSDIEIEDLETFINENAKKLIKFDDVKSIFQKANPEYIADEIFKKLNGGG